ncbi:TetR/AcrR family transcriptional regulator [Sphingomonas sp. ac-8]|uniref:TetR/AcrR family transcriptional regulator n=1 Tax=Sphingomonas sp. ac-8 TaxID=3242977 RepID=UPI003A7FDB3B
MVSRSQRSERRTEALTRERIVEAAIAILDAEGERALTFRALATRLATGSGAIYWHVADKDALLAAAADHVVGLAMDTVGASPDPRAAIREIALALFDAFDAHPWVGAQLSLDPTQAATLRFFEGIGGRLQSLGVPEGARFDAWSACVNYIMGVAGQNAANARRHPGEADRRALLGAVAERWGRLDPAEYPFLRAAAAQLPGHDDRDQFAAGIELILAGLAPAR